MKYQYQHVQTDYVAQNIDEFIIPECQEGCKAFWNKNIMTYMCSNYDKGESTYILVSKLSPENEEKFKKLIESDPSHYYISEFRRSYGIRTEETDAQRASKKLIQLTEPFIIQDIYEGKLTREEFLVNIVGLKHYIDNPEYDLFIKSHVEPKFEDFEDISDYYDAYEKYQDSIPPQIIVVLDKDQMTKTFGEYLVETGYQDLYDPELDVVFKSKFYKDAHQRYLQSQLGKKDDNINNRPDESDYER